MAPSGNAAGITGYDSRHIRTDGDEAVDANWTVKDDAWTTGSGALQYVLTGWTAAHSTTRRCERVSSAGDGPWSATVTGNAGNHRTASNLRRQPDLLIGVG